MKNSISTHVFINYLGGGYSGGDLGRHPLMSSWRGLYCCGFTSRMGLCMVIEVGGVDKR